MQQKTVFISYRRALSKHLARSIYQDLKMNGWDVFLDVNTIDSGDFDRIILNQIGARAHFILLISPDSLKRCANPGDWVLREIEEAVRLNRNIVPIVEEGADFTREMGYLPTEVQAIVSKKNALPLPHFFFDPAMDMLRTRFLKTPEYIRITDVPVGEQAEVQRRLQQVEAQASSPLPAQRSGEGPGVRAMQRARTFAGKRNRDWEPYVTTFDDLKIKDMPFCLVPVGTFNMGSDDGHYNDEQPVHSQRIEQPYWIAQFPVTNAQWKVAVQAGAVKEPYKTGDALKWYRDPAMADAPVVGVNWFMARDFAAWMGCRLPSEMEWEYAARGVESLRYPWGNVWNPEIPVWEKNSGGKPASVTSRPEGKSWVAAWHMIGNVWEWTSSLFKPYPYRAQDGRERDTRDSTNVLRGASWRYSHAAPLRSACRLSSGAPGDHSGSEGFRLARS